MYFKRLCKERVTFFFIIALTCCIFFDFFNLENDDDFIKWQLRSLVLVVSFFIFHYALANTICKVIFTVIRKLVRCSNFVGKYRLNFTNSCIYVKAPLGAFAHKWNQIEKAILTKDFFFLYVKDADHHIITISNRGKNDKKRNDLIAFVEHNVTEITKV
ncbi:hypothetical protein [Flavobacterium poyangense]|uniref:hypothetical protein n=1 Tax=Flavobacterium poyangense TaxID=2204302 RepID=UPI001423435D|nr:hypothetical protein [Flavobacterium sp. JXAS1]